MFTKEIKAAVKKITKNANGRSQLEHPYKDGAHIVATDGHRLIRVPAVLERPDGHYSIDGHRVDTDLQYPAWRQVIPTTGKVYSVGMEQFKSLPKKLAGPVGGHGWITLLLDDKSITVNLGYLIDVLCTFPSHGSIYISFAPSDVTGDVQWVTGPIKIMDEPSDDESALLWILMPVRYDGGLTLSIEGTKV